MIKFSFLNNFKTQKREAKKFASLFL